jgi:hypothetical protein
MKIVYVKWRDAQHSSNYWDEGELLTKWGPGYIAETIGFLLKTNSEDEVVVAHEHTALQGRFKHITGIPKRYIIEMYELRKK